MEIQKPSPKLRKALGTLYDMEILPAKNTPRDLSLCVRGLGDAMLYDPAIVKTMCHTNFERAWVRDPLARCRLGFDADILDIKLKVRNQRITMPELVEVFDSCILHVNKNDAHVISFPLNNQPKELKPISAKCGDILRIDLHWPVAPKLLRDIELMAYMPVNLYLG